jgi:hypothetical protein
VPSVEVVLAVPERAIRRIASLPRRLRPRNSTPMISNSSLRQPIPTPSVKRPPKSSCRVATCFARVHGVVERDNNDGGAEPDSFRPAGDPTKRDERVVNAAVRINCLGTDDDVLRRSDRVEAKLLGGLGNATNAVEGRVPAVLRQDDTEVRSRIATERSPQLATSFAHDRWPENAQVFYNLLQLMTEQLTTSREWPDRPSSATHGSKRRAGGSARTFLAGSGRSFQAGPTGQPWFVTRSKVEAKTPRHGPARNWRIHWRTAGVRRHFACK